MSVRTEYQKKLNQLQTERSTLLQQYETELSQAQQFLFTSSTSSSSSNNNIPQVIDMKQKVVELEKKITDLKQDKTTVNWLLRVVPILKGYATSNFTTTNFNTTTTNNSAINNVCSYSDHPSFFQEQQVAESSFNPKSFAMNETTSNTSNITSMNNPSSSFMNSQHFQYNNGSSSVNNKKKLSKPFRYNNSNSGLNSSGRGSSSSSKNSGVRNRNNRNMTIGIGMGSGGGGGRRVGGGENGFMNRKGNLYQQFMLLSEGKSLYSLANNNPLFVSDFHNGGGGGGGGSGGSGSGGNGVGSGGIGDGTINENNKILQDTFHLLRQQQHENEICKSAGICPKRGCRSIMQKRSEEGKEICEKCGTTVPDIETSGNSMYGTEIDYNSNQAGIHFMQENAFRDWILKKQKLGTISLKDYTVVYNETRELATNQITPTRLKYILKKNGIKKAAEKINALIYLLTQKIPQQLSDKQIMVMCIFLRQLMQPFQNYNVHGLDWYPNEFLMVKFLDLLQYDKSWLNFLSSTCSTTFTFSTSSNKTTSSSNNTNKTTSTSSTSTSNNRKRVGSSNSKRVGGGGNKKRGGGGNTGKDYFKIHRQEYEEIFFKSCQDLGW